ncbi:hypothetical protein DTO271D3_6022 [Paecilomyces variotii]|nr:hypothetical protein DTO271D3_6022 [Paecilomyces variotii]
MHCATIGTVISLFEASTKVAGTFYQERNQIREDQGGSGPFDIFSQWSYRDWEGDTRTSRMGLSGSYS